MKHVQLFEQFINDQDFVITPKTFKKNKKVLTDVVMQVYEPGVYAPDMGENVLNMLVTQLERGNKSDIESVTLKGQPGRKLNKDSEIYVRTKKGAIYDRGNLGTPNVLDRLK